MKTSQRLLQISVTALTALISQDGLAFELPEDLRELARKQDREAEAQCSPVDLAAKHPQLPLDQARNQSTGWCFAFSTADLLSIKLGEEVSASALASAYYARAPISGGNLSKTLRNITTDVEDFFRFTTPAREGGFLDRMLQTAVQDGYVCSESSIPSQFDSNGDIEEYNEAIVQLEKDHMDLIELTEEDVKEDPNCVGSETREAAKALFPGINLVDLVRVAKEVPYQNFHEELVAQSCDKIPLPKGKAKFKVRNIDLDEREDYLEDSAGQAGMKAINEQLSRGNPLLIAYSSVGLYMPKASLRPSRDLHSFNGQVVKFPDADADHASVVTGRKWSTKNGGQCLYAIKNSWGTDCSQYSKEHECRDGVVWVNADHLSDMISTVTWVE